MSDHCDSKEIRAWVTAHRNALPQTLPELSRYPMAYRRAIYGAVAPAVREALWREHCQRFLGRESKLSAGQQELVREVVAELPALVGDDREAAQAQAHAFELRMQSLFTREEATAIFATLGPAEPSGRLPFPTM